MKSSSYVIQRLEKVTSNVGLSRKKKKKKNILHGTNSFQEEKNVLNNNVAVYIKYCFGIQISRNLSEIMFDLIS